MADPPNSLNPPSPPPSKSNLPLLYYGLVVVGTAAIVLAIYNLLIVRWCAHQRRRSHQEMIRRRTFEPTSSRSFDSMNLVCSFKYKKEGGDEEDVGYEYECVVCLSVFKEGEEVKQLIRCKHLFHALCIDMWLYSHLDCPLCRAPVEPPDFHHRHVVMTPLEHSREGLLNPDISV